MLHTKRDRNHAWAGREQTHTNRRHAALISEQSTQSEQSQGSTLTQSEQSHSLTLAEKARAFRALLSPAACGHGKHDVSNEQVQQLRNLSQCLEDAGNCVKFKSNSSNSKKTGSFTPDKPPDEFHISYGQDQENATDKNIIDSYRKMTAEPHRELLVVPGLINDVWMWPEHLFNRPGGAEVDNRLNEFQRTYEEDRQRRGHPQRIHEALHTAGHISDTWPCPVTGHISDTWPCPATGHISDTWPCPATGHISDTWPCPETGQCYPKKCPLTREKVKQFMQRPLYSCVQTGYNKSSTRQKAEALGSPQKSSLLEQHRELGAVDVSGCEENPKSAPFVTDRRLLASEGKPSFPETCASRNNCDHTLTTSQDTTSAGKAIKTVSKASSTTSHVAVLPVSHVAVLPVSCASGLQQTAADIDVLGASLSTSQLAKKLESRFNAVLSHNRNHDVLSHNRNHDVLSHNRNHDVLSHNRNHDVLSHNRNHAVLSHNRNHDVLSHNRNHDVLSHNRNHDVLSHSRNHAVLSHNRNHDVLSHNRNTAQDAGERDVIVSSSGRTWCRSCSASVAGVPAQVASHDCHLPVSATASDTTALGVQSQQRCPHTSPPGAWVNEPAPSAQFSTGNRQQTNVRISAMSGTNSLVLADKPVWKNRCRNPSSQTGSPRYTNVLAETECALAECSPLAHSPGSHRRRISCRTACQASSGHRGTDAGHHPIIIYGAAPTGEVADIDDVGDGVCHDVSDDICDDDGDDICNDVDVGNAIIVHKQKTTSTVQPHRPPSHHLSSSTKSVPVQPALPTATVPPEKTPVPPVRGRLPGTTSDHTSRKCAHQCQSHGNKLFTRTHTCDGNIADKKIIVIKRPTVEESKRGRHTPLQEGEKGIMHRSKSALEMLSRYNKHPASSKCRQTETRRPRSCLDNAQFISTLVRTGTTTEHQKHVRTGTTTGHQKHVREKWDSQLYKDDVRLLGDQVRRLHTEIQQRLQSQANVVCGVRQGELTKQGDSHRSGQREHEIDHTRSIDTVDDLHGFMNTSVLSTSTPIKHTPRGPQHTDGLPAQSVPNNVNIFKEGWTFDQISEKHIAKSQNEILNHRHNFDDILTNSLKTIIADKNHVTSNIAHQTLRNAACASHSYSAQETVAGQSALAGSLHSALAGSLHPALAGSQDIKQTDSLDDPCGQISATCRPSSCMEPATSHTSFRQPVDKYLMMKYSSSHGRASPVERLLVHLDDPKVVTLLQKLYSVDYETRQAIMITVQLFKAWQSHTVSCREHRTRKEALADTSARCCRHRMLTCHFAAWRTKTSDRCNMRRATALCRGHALRQGFRALRWSVRQSQDLCSTIQVRLQAIKVKASFQKWKSEAARQRQEHLRSALNRWRHVLTETQKIHQMTEIIQEHITVDVWRCWRTQFGERVKTNMACSLVRKTLLRRTFASWRAHYSQQTEKRDKYSLAVSQHQHALLKSHFLHIVASFRQVHTAKTYVRHHRLSQAFWAWKTSIHVCRLERQLESAVSRQHWEQQTQKRFFVTWKESLAFSSAATAADLNLCRKSFLTWKQAWESQQAHYQTITARLTRLQLHDTLRTWRGNVARLRRRQQGAVALIEKCYLRHIWQSWRVYVSAKAILRMNAQLRQVVTRHRVLAGRFSQWQRMYRQAKVVRQLWSATCARMLRGWKLHTSRMCYLRKLQERFARLTETRVMGSVFRKLQQRADYCARLDQMADTVIRDKTLAKTRTLLAAWRQRLHEIMASRYYQHILAVRGVQRWRRFVHTRRQARLQEQQNWRTASAFNHQHICKNVFSALKLAVMVSRWTEQRRQNLCLRYAQVWKSRVDMDATARLLERETGLRGAWSKWRHRLAQAQACQRVDEHLRTQDLSQVLTAWRDLLRPSHSAAMSAAGLSKMKQNRH